MSLKQSIRQYAYELGADLVGVGDVGRCRHAPLMMSPQGLYPQARSVIVMALHHPDACIERGGEKHPQEIGPYSVQYRMNSRLDEMSYLLATFIERQGFGAMPIVSSNIWRYNEYKDLKAVFAPDISHIYMAVVAGLADMGYNGLALTPEYGARNRFITVLTDAELDPDPLIPPGTVCDECMLCRKHCPTQAFDKEVDGDKVLHIDDYEYRFPNKNLWRCSWGEHFDLDLDLEIPERVDEEVILDTLRKHGSRGGEMGQCLKFCLPRNLREVDREYSRTPVRKSWIHVDESIESRALTDRLLSAMEAGGAGEVTVTAATDLALAGIDLNEELPGAVSVVILTRAAAVDGPPESRALFNGAAHGQIDNACLALCRQLDELGFRSLMTVSGGGEHAPRFVGPELATRIAAAALGTPDVATLVNVVITRKHVAARVPESHQVSRPTRTRALAPGLLDLARSLGADLASVTPVERLDAIATQLRPHLDGRERMVAVRGGSRFVHSVAEARLEREVLRTPADYLPGARSVLVLGVRYHEAVLAQATKPPAEAVGPYAFLTSVTAQIASGIGVKLVQELNRHGYRACLAADLMNTAGHTATPRGLIESLRANRFAAVAAGLGQLTLSGHVATPEFGIRQRFLAIVTDAPLEAAPVTASVEGLLCADCDRPCVSRCPSAAFSAKEIQFELEGVAQRFLEVDAKRCDWSRRYALTAASGFGFLGSPLDEPPPEEMTIEALVAALERHDPIKSIRSTVAEPCVITCPYATTPI